MFWTVPVLDSERKPPSCRFWVQVFRSDPFPELPLGAQFAVTVLALPVPEQWERFYNSQIFSTRCERRRARSRAGSSFALILKALVCSVCREERPGPVQPRSTGELLEGGVRGRGSRPSRCGVLADWYPTYLEVTQEGSNATVTFNLAPPHLGIGSYFLQCYANGRRLYAEITAVSSALKPREFRTDGNSACFSSGFLRK